MEAKRSRVWWKIEDVEHYNEVSSMAEIEREGELWAEPAEEPVGRLEKCRVERFAEIARDMELGKDGFSAEQRKWIRDDPEICKLSIGRDNSTLLILAVNFRCAQMFEELMATQACDAMAVDCDGFSALMLAAVARDEVAGEKMARALIEQSSMKEPSGKQEDVEFAIRRGNIKIARLLVEARGEWAVSAEGPLLKSFFGENWLHMALASEKRGEALAWVLSLPSARLMFNSGDMDGRTPWDLAMGQEGAWPGAIRRLMEARACWERDDLSQDVSIDKNEVGKRPVRL